MFRFVKNIISIILIYFSRYLDKNGIIILEYHRVSRNISSNDVHSITPEEFRFQIKLLKDLGYKFLDLPSAIQLLKHGLAEKDKYIVLTFDDGHKDNLTFAYPILKEFNAVATFFIISDYVGKTGWLDNFGILHNEKSNNFQRWELLNWEEIKSMKDHFFIQVHGRTHRQMDKLSLKELDDELQISRVKINSELNINALVFCYPFGRYNDQVVTRTNENGYIGACSTNQGINIPQETNLWKLKRNEVGRGISKNQFRLLLTNQIITYNYLSTLFNMFKKQDA